MRPLYVRLMDKLYLVCVVVGVVSVVSMVTLIFTGVVMRYVFEMGARFAEPMSIFSPFSSPCTARRPAIACTPTCACRSS